MEDDIESILVLENEAIKKVECITVPKVNQSLTAAPLGLFGFGISVFMFAFYNAQIVTSGPINAVIGIAMFYGGMIQVLTSMWDIKSGNALAAAISGSFGAYNMATALNLHPSTGLIDAYGTPEELNQATGVIFIAMTVFSLMMTAALLKTSIVQIVLMALVAVDFAILAGGLIANNNTIVIVGGYVGFTVSFGALYLGMSLLCNKENSYFEFPLGVLH